jgi:hypothetical protein
VQAKCKEAITEQTTPPYELSSPRGDGSQVVMRFKKPSYFGFFKRLINPVAIRLLFGIVGAPIAKEKSCSCRGYRRFTVRGVIGGLDAKAY